MKKIILGLIVCLITGVTTACFSAPAQEVAPQVPTNITYDDQRYVLSWDKVDHADRYQVSINGVIKDANENLYTYFPTEKETKFKVRAINSKAVEGISDWSEVYTYNVKPVEETGLNLMAINTYVSDYFGGSFFERIIYLYSKDENVFGISIQDGVVQWFIYMYDHKVDSLAQVISNNDYVDTPNLGVGYVKEYDTANYYLQNRNLVGVLKEYRDQGYSIEAITSQVYEISDSRIGLVGAYKVSLGDDVKYFAVQNNFFINATAVERIRYTDSVKNLETTFMRVESCGEITGDFITALNIYSTQVAPK